MTHGSLTTYLNDHLAGSVAGLELLDHIIQLRRGSALESPLIVIRSEIEEDQKVLQALLHGVGGSESRVRQAAAWLSEKLARAKLRIDDGGSGELQLLEALEALALGIQGKVALWRALQAASSRLPAPQRLDFAALEQRALSQFERVDRLRLQAASSALSS
jgi:hypothetical protein